MAAGAGIINIRSLLLDWKMFMLSDVPASIRSLRTWLKIQMRLQDQMKSTMHQAVSRISESFESMGNLLRSPTEQDDLEDSENYSVREARSRDNWKIYQLMSSFFPEDGESQEESKLSFSEHDLHDALFRPDPVSQSIVAVYSSQGGEILVGYCLYNIVKMETAFLLIEDIFVHPAFRATWVSRKMLMHVKNNVVSSLNATDESYKILRWDANDYDEMKVNFYRKYGARLIAEYRPVLRDAEEKQDTLTYDVLPVKKRLTRNRTLANLKLSTFPHDRGQPLFRDRCRSLVPPTD